MSHDFKNICSEFTRIKAMGWIESVNNGHGGVGLTFENLLGITSNELEVPDYNGIEIKTKRELTKSFKRYITLFSCKPEGSYYHEVERIKDTYGYPHRELKQYMVLNNSVYGNKKNKIGIKYFFKLDVSYNDKKIYLEIYNLKMNLIEKEVYWDFCDLEEKLERKLKYLALIYAKAKRDLTTNKEQFKYEKLYLYKLKGFSTFLNLIERGIIRVNFKLNIWSSGEKIGKIHDHGTSFDIEEFKIEELYEKIY